MKDENAAHRCTLSEEFLTQWRKGHNQSLSILLHTVFSAVRIIAPICNHLFHLVTAKGTIILRNI